MKYLVEKYSKIITRADAYDLYHIIIKNDEEMLHELKKAGFNVEELDDWGLAKPKLDIEGKKLLLSVAMNKKPIDTCALLARLMFGKSAELYSMALEVIYYSIIEGEASDEMIEKYKRIKRELEWPLINLIGEEVSIIERVLQKQNRSPNTPRD